MIELTMDMIFDYENSLHKHITHVQEACGLLGVDYEQSEKHDASKWESAEFLHYVRQFKGPKDDPNGFVRAWLHHIHHNPHHWQYWIFPDGYARAGSDIENGIVEMPQAYCLEMIADWLGASMAYTGSWDMTDWLYKNFTKVRLHSRSLAFVIDTLSDLGYSFILLQAGYNPRNPTPGKYPDEFVSTRFP